MHHASYLASCSSCSSCSSRLSSSLAASAFRSSVFNASISSSKAWFEKTGEEGDQGFRPPLLQHAMCPRVPPTGRSRRGVISSFQDRTSSTNRNRHIRSNQPEPNNETKDQIAEAVGRVLPSKIDPTIRTSRNNRRV